MFGWHFFIFFDRILDMSNVSKFLVKFYAFKFLNMCVFLYPVMAVMFGANGVSDVGIGTLMAIWAMIPITMTQTLKIIKPILYPLNTAPMVIRP